MASDIPYMSSAKNLPAILAKIKAAGTPPKFTHEFLKANLGFPSSNDRAVIGVLKALGFLSADSTPTARYNDFRNDDRSGSAMATGLREGWSEVFLSDEKAYERTSSQLTELFKNVTGSGEAVATKMATTFKALTAVADWKSATAPAVGTEPQESSAEREAAALGVSLHHDVHIHLPATSDVSVYTAIFRAIRSELVD